MPKHLAITIAGAVSLGSYEAGVLYEVLEALRLHNTKTKNEDQKIYIDVITGASAGAMTAALAAQRLLYDPKNLIDAEKNAFYEAWVKTINLWSLVRMKRKEEIWHSLLSSDLIEAIGTKMLVETMKDSPKLTCVHPAIELQRTVNGEPARDADGNLIPKPLWLGMALTNLNGLSYGYPLLEGRGARFQYTRSVDQLARKLPGAAGQALDLWKTVRDAAVGSGAFPFAFRPKAIKRHRQEFDDTNLEDWAKHPPQDKTFTYTDGGVLQNQPLGLAKNLIDRLVQERLEHHDQTAYNDADSRLYLFVSPHALQSGVSVGFTAEKANFFRMTDELARTYARQADFHDWIMAEQMNQQVNCLDERARQLADAIRSGKVNVAPLKDASTQLATLLLGSNEARIQAIARLTAQYPELYKQMAAAGPEAAGAWVNSILTLELAANLQTRDRMNILAVTANGKNDLAGAGISSFVGFFSRKFREHDYLVGRKYAREYLRNQEVQRILGEITLHGPEPPDPASTNIKTPVPLWRALCAGSPALSWIVLWRCIRLLLSPFGIALILILVILIFILR